MHGGLRETPAVRIAYVEINNYRQQIGLDKARGPLVGAGELEREMSAAQLEAWRREYLEPHVDFGRANADWVRGSTCCAQFFNQFLTNS